MQMAGVLRPSGAPSPVFSPVAAAAGAEDLWEAPPTVGTLYRAHRLDLVRLATFLVDDVATAEDVVQDVFARLAGRGKVPDTAAGALAYLRKSVVNGSRDVLRRRRTARSYVPPNAGHAPSADVAVVLADEHREVLAALQTLPPRQREVLVLRYWADLSEANIAATLRISRGTVKSTASRALTSLESALRSSS